MILTGMCYPAPCQTFLWEPFDAGQMPPPGWTIDGLPGQWSASCTHHAGGLNSEARFTYAFEVSTTRLISPPMNLSDLSSVKISFRHFYDDYPGSGPVAGVATRSNYGNWHSVWEINPGSNAGPEWVDLTITNTDVGQQAFQICFYLNGNLDNIEYWYLDDVLVFDPLNLDAMLTTLTGTPPHIGGPSPVKGMVMNVGLTPVTSLEIIWQLDNGVTQSSDFTGLSLGLQDTFAFICSGLMDPPAGNHFLAVWINRVNDMADDFPENDTCSSVVERSSHVIQRVPLFEEFTSSTCDPCAVFNAGFIPWCEQHGEDITLIKYPMNWPGAGDPYYTEEGGVRRDYYEIGFVPDLYVNGTAVPTNIPAVQQVFDDATDQPGFMDMVSRHTLNGTVIQVEGTVLPFASFSGCRMHIAVMEKTTHNNTATNGETEFHHVMMKMIPGAEGTMAEFADRQPFSFNETIDLTGTFFEEWDDLIVGIFIQNSFTREVYQSGYTVENGLFSSEARLSDILIDGISVQGFDPDVFAYDVYLPPGSTTVPETEGIPVDTNETVIVIPAFSLPGITTLDVFAQDLITRTAYTIHFFTGGVGTDKKTVQPIMVYPNPARGSITVTGTGPARISLMSAGGITVKETAILTDSTLDLGNLPGGIYILKIDGADGRVIYKKIIVLPGN